MCVCLCLSRSVHIYRRSEHDSRQGFSVQPRATSTQQMAVAGIESVTVWFQGVLLEH